MQKNCSDKNIVLSSWSDGRHIDRWTFVHFLAGFLISSLLYDFGVSPIYTFLVVFVIAVAWEIYETVRKIYEPISNRLSDIVITIIGFFIVANVQIFQYLNVYIILILILYIALLTRGWLIWKNGAKG